MRCQDVTREFAAPSGRLDPSAMASHLASCPSCAGFAERSARLDRLWDAAGPPSPPPGAFEMVWAGVERAEEAAPFPQVPRRRGVVRWVAVAGLAQAAAVLVAALILNRPTPGPSVPGQSPPVAARAIRVEIEEGQLVIIPIDGREGVKVVDLPPGTTLDAVAPDFDVLNEFEAMASL